VSRGARGSGASAVALAALLAAAPRPPGNADPAALAGKYAEAVRELNEDHARKPQASEDELAAKLPAAARKAFDELVRAKPSEDLAAALATAAEAAADLDLEADFEAARAALEKLSEEEAARLGRLVSRPRFVVRGTGLSQAYFERFADVAQAVLEGYDEVFGFDELSKVPGKKLRFRVHLVPRIERPPHFAPQFPHHSEVDFPVDDAEALRSPTSDGKFLFYGLCHEIGHVVAMWGDRSNEEDHHAWAHYTGVAVLEHLAQDKGRAKALKGLDDVRWRSLEKERDAAKGVEPSLGSREGVMALLVALHDAVGPKAIGDAIDALDREDRRLRINRVRYYRFPELEEALLDGAKDAKRKKAIEALFP
jgi:hypothetical protein